MIQRTYVGVLVDDAEGLVELVPGVPLAHLVRHHVHELVEVDGAAAVLVHLRDHLADLLRMPDSIPFHRSPPTTYNYNYRACSH
jgi:hypothetical protein